MGSLDHKLYALNAATGDFAWSYPTGDEIVSTPAVADGTVYVGSSDGNLYALGAASGELKWKYCHGRRNLFVSMRFQEAWWFLGHLTVKCMHWML